MLSKRERIRIARLAGKASAKKRKGKSKFTHASVKAEYRKENIRLLSVFKLVGVLNKLECMICGRNWKAKLNDLRNGHGCRDCALGKISHNQAEKNCADNNIKLLSNFTRVRDKHKLLCLKCENKWQGVISSRCKKCASKAHSIYLIKRVDSFKKLKKLLRTRKIELKEILSDGCAFRAHSRIKVTCERNHEWETSLSILSNQKHGCYTCFYSKKQQPSQLDVFELVKKIVKGRKVLFNDRKIISPLELDIVIPSRKIAIEYNGRYWHSRKFIPKGYHQRKSARCRWAGYKLYTIWDDNWQNSKKKPKIIKFLKEVLR